MFQTRLYLRHIFKSCQVPSTWVGEFVELINYLLVLYLTLIWEQASIDSFELRSFVSESFCNALTDPSRMDVGNRRRFSLAIKNLLYVVQCVIACAQTETRQIRENLQ